MYTSPIEEIYGELQVQMAQEDENMVMKAVREVGIIVDKEELINALQYDRKQYTKGYSDGKSDTLDKVKTEIEQVGAYYQEVGKHERADAFLEVLSIVDKCKAESEEK